MGIEVRAVPSFPPGERGYVRTCKNPVSQRDEQVEVATPAGGCNRQVAWTVRPFSGELAGTGYKDFLEFLIVEFGISAGNNTNEEELVSAFRFSPDLNQVQFKYCTKRATVGDNDTLVLHSVRYDRKTGKVSLVTEGNGFSDVGPIGAPHDPAAVSGLPPEIETEFGSLPVEYQRRLSTVDCRGCSTPYWAAIYFVWGWAPENRLLIFDLHGKKKHEITQEILFDQFGDRAFGRDDRIYSTPDGGRLLLKSMPSPNVFSISVKEGAKIEVANGNGSGVLPRGRVLGDGLSPDGRTLVYSSYNELGYPLYSAVDPAMVSKGLKVLDSVIWFKALDTGALDYLIHPYGSYAHDRWHKWGDQ